MSSSHHGWREREVDDASGLRAVARRVVAVVLSCLLSTLAVRAAAESVSLAGTWRFQLDRHNAGIEEKWFARQLPDRIRLSGSLPEQGIGDDISVDTKWTGDIIDKSWFTAPEYAKYRQPGNVKVPFWLQPGKYYAGVAWYQRQVRIPAAWASKRVVLFLERPHWETRVWLDGRELGSNNSLSTAHEYVLGPKLSPGTHEVTIRIDNRLVVDIGVNSHSICDHTQGNWNGVVGRIELRAEATPWLEDLQVYPSVSSNRIRVKGRIGFSGLVSVAPSVRFALARAGNNRGPEIIATAAVTLEPSGSEQSTAGTFETDISLGFQPLLWDEFQPSLYRLTAAVSNGATTTVIFGFRDLSTQGTQFLLNGHKAFFRGTLECCIFPKTGHAPTDVGSWKRIIRIAKAHGLNLIRFHSWCPPEAAFEAADELGFYYQVEIASWANQSTTLGDGLPVDRWLYEEAERILKCYGNHPSFMLMPYGNEPGGEHASAYLAKWVQHWKAADTRRLYTSGSGWPEIAENQFHVVPDPRIQAWGQGLKSRINARPPETQTDYGDYISNRKVPIISHEIGQWCVYPNFDEIPKYTGYLKPRNFEIFRDSLAEHHMSRLAHKFLIASGKLQALCYKEEIESALRTPGMGGFELLDLHDFPGQGTALVGVLDPFWEDKGYITASEFRRFCNHTVPLARLSKRVFTTAERLEAKIEVAHFGSMPLQQAATQWLLTGVKGNVIAKGILPTCTIPVDNATFLGRVAVELKKVPAPAKLKLVVRLTARTEPGQRTAGAFENDWDVWVYSSKVDIQPPAGLLVTRDFNETAKNALNSGRKVLLLIPKDRVKGDGHGAVALGFSSIFWNTAWTGRQPPHTLGILCEPTNPAFADFPTDFHSNWQWWYLISRAGGMILDNLPVELQPTVQVIDDWVTNRKLGLILEAKVAAGKVLVSSIDLETDLEQNPVARQMRFSLLQYMKGSHFKPAVRLSPAQIEGLFNN